ncbi:MAG: OmpA family protein [Gemmatimonadota bacterium]
MKTVLTIALLASAPGCMGVRATAHGSNAMLTPVAMRITDEAIAHDLAVFEALGRRLSSAPAGNSGDRDYLHARARHRITAARTAYERNDRSPFPDDMLALARRDIEVLEARDSTATRELITSSVLFPNDVRVVGTDIWTAALEIRKESGALASPAEIAEAESILLRAGHHILAGPVCLPEDSAVASAAAMIERQRQRPADTTMVVPPRPAPVPPDAPALPGPAATPRCASREEVAGLAGTVHFALDSSALSEATTGLIDAIGRTLAARSNVRLRISGHTDVRATGVYNLALSLRRVEAVAGRLEAMGIARDRISTSARGEDRPIAAGHDIRDHARNRRVELIFVLCDGTEVNPGETLLDLQPETSRPISRRGGRSPR